MTDTRTRILDLAEGLTQTKGFNGFSYLDLAAGIGVKSSSIHYHFKAKADLALALVQRHRERLNEVYAQFDRDLDTPQERLQAILTHFKGYIADDRICMCGMMAAEFESINIEVRRELAHYFRDFQNWLAKQFSQLNHANPPTAALQFLSGLEGSLLIARLEGDASIVAQATNGFVTQ